MKFNSWICRRVLNRQHPEATVLETYRVYCCLLYFYFMGACPGHYGSVHVHVGIFITSYIYTCILTHMKAMWLTVANLYVIVISLSQLSSVD